MLKARKPFVRAVILPNFTIRGGLETLQMFRPSGVKNTGSTALYIIIPNPILAFCRAMSWAGVLAFPAMAVIVLWATQQ